MDGARPESFELGAWLDRGPAALAGTFGDLGARALWRALERFIAWCPAIAEERVRVHSPCLEGM